MEADRRGVAGAGRARTLGLDFATIWRRVGEVHRDLNAYATGGRGLEPQAGLVASLRRLRPAVTGPATSSDIATLAALISDFAVRAEHPLVHRAEYFLEQDLWIEWTSRLSGYDYGNVESDYWPLWITDKVTDTLTEDAIEQRLAALGLISIWRGTNYGGPRRLDMTFYHEGSQWSARVERPIAA